jgi:hypothetical protein
VWVEHLHGRRSQRILQRGAPDLVSQAWLRTVVVGRPAVLRTEVKCQVSAGRHPPHPRAPAFWMSWMMIDRSWRGGSTIRKTAAYLEPRRHHHDRGRRRRTQAGSCRSYRCSAATGSRSIAAVCAPRTKTRACNGQDLSASHASASPQSLTSDPTRGSNLITNASLRAQLCPERKHGAYHAFVMLLMQGNRREDPAKPRVCLDSAADAAKHENPNQGSHPTPDELESLRLFSIGRVRVRGCSVVRLPLVLLVLLALEHPRCPDDRCQAAPAQRWFVRVRVSVGGPLPVCGVTLMMEWLGGCWLPHSKPSGAFLASTHQGQPNTQPCRRRRRVRSTVGGCRESPQRSRTHQQHVETIKTALQFSKLGWTFLEIWKARAVQMQRKSAENPRRKPSVLATSASIRPILVVQWRRDPGVVVGARLLRSNKSRSKSVQLATDCQQCQFRISPL